jgi:hypothetical protein
MCRADSLRAVAEEISKYKLDLVGVQEVRWDEGGTKPAGGYTFFYGKCSKCFPVMGINDLHPYCQRKLLDSRIFIAYTGI